MLPRIAGVATMTMIEETPQIADCFGVPTFFATEVVTEPAGGGCVRLYGCVRQRGLLIPQYQVIMPHTSMLTCSRTAREAALTALKDEMGALAH